MVFSYMMLFQVKSSSESIHWTEIYVIVAVSTAFIEEVRTVSKHQVHLTSFVSFPINS